MLDKATDLRTRAERKAGQMLAESRDRGERARSGVDTRNQESPPPTLAQIGVTRDQSSKWQQVAALTDDEFEDALATTAAFMRFDAEETKRLQAEAGKQGGRGHKKNPVTDSSQGLPKPKRAPTTRKKVAEAVGVSEHKAQQAINVEAERKACDVRLRAERRVGELLKELQRSPLAGGGNTREEPGGNGGRPVSAYREAIDANGISECARRARGPF